MKTKGFLRALVQKRGSDGRWIYLLWLVGYCVVAFIAVAYAAVLGQDYVSAFAVLLAPALIAYIQFRYPTVTGWALLTVPTVLWAAIAGLLFLGALFRGEFGLEPAVLVLWLGTVSWGLVHYRPFASKHAVADPRLHWTAR